MLTSHPILASGLAGYCFALAISSIPFGPINLTILNEGSRRGYRWALLIGLPLGCWCALRRDGWFDRAMALVSAACIALPTSLVAIYALLLFAVRLHWFPSIGAGRPHGFHASLLEFFIETLAAVALLAVLIYIAYRHSARLADFIGSTGTSIVVRLSAFLLFCIGIQILWNGLSELLGTLPIGSAGTS